MSDQLKGKISDTAIRQEVERILQSPMFMQSDRLSRFLRFTVDHVISGSTDVLKEYVIGTEVYDRKPSYHPSQDSIVRTEARRLRSKLKEYYELDGKDDPVFIFFRPGSYLRRGQWSAGCGDTVSGPLGHAYLQTVCVGYYR